MTDREWYVRLGERLREARKARGWTIYDVAAVTGSSAVAVSMWERGKNRMHAHYYVALREEGLL